MKANLTAKFWLCFAVFGCFNCMEPGGPEEDAAPDAADADETDALPDLAEDEAGETPEETGDAEEAEDSSPDEAAFETEDSVPEDGGSEESIDGEDGDAGEDGETVDFCIPPEIPPTGLYLFFCFPEDIPVDITLWRWISLEWYPTVLWSEESGCSTTDKPVLFCEVEHHRAATYYMNIEISFLDTAWACGPGLTTPYGRPRVWLAGEEQTLILSGDGAGGCYFEFSTPS